MSAPVRAAGAVLWRPRPAGSGVEVAVVHRPRYDDWSLPKGHVEAGEHPAVTAVREVAEETGFAAVLGRHLGRTGYRVDARPKEVEHWAARAVGGAFAVNDEVDALRWLPVAEAAELVTHRGDADVLARFAALPAATHTLLLVRHARAGTLGDVPDDRLRPLQPAGWEQARALVALCGAFGASAVHAADRTRCEQTVQPLADALGVPVHREPRLSEEGFADDPPAALARAGELLSGPGVRVVCSQGGVIPTVVQGWAHRDGVAVADLRTRKASTWVVSSVEGRVVALDHLPDPRG